MEAPCRRIYVLLYAPQGYIYNPMDAATKKASLARLTRIAGQVRGVARMVEEDRYCIDVLTQLRAAQAALAKVEQEVLEDHLRHCVAQAFSHGGEDDRQRMIRELVEVLERRR